MRKMFLVLTLVLVFSGLVSALEFSIDKSSDVMVRGVDNKISLNITVTEASKGLYNFYTLSDMMINPINVFRETNSSFKREFIIEPRSTLDEKGNYAFDCVLEQIGIKKYPKRQVIKFVEISDAISIYSDSIDSDSGQVSFYVENLVSADMKNLSAKFSSVLFETEKVFDLGPNEKKEIFVYADVNSLKKTKAGVYIIEGVFETSYGDTVIEGNLYLGEKKGITSTEDKSGLLVRTQTITKVNAGNVVESVEVKMEQNIFSRFFTSFNLEPFSIEREGSTIEYTWVKNRLEPGEAYVVKAKTNYLLPFLILVCLIIGFSLLRKYMANKLDVKKSVVPVKTKTGEFALRVRLQLKARTNLENVKLVDRVPAMVRIYNKFTPVRPDKIDSKTRRLHWHIGDLVSGEVRVFDYIVYSKVGIFGKFILPEAKAFFEKDGKLSETLSNKVFFMNEQVNSN